MVVNMKKISTRLYLLLNAVIYFGMIMLNEFVINTFGLTYKLILTIVFAAMIFLHFAFFQIHYNDFLNNTIVKNVLLAILSFFMSLLLILWYNIS